MYVYAEASVGSSKSNSDSTTWQNTTLSGQNISLKAAGDTTLRGATATADRIDVQTGGTLSIESLQDTAESMSKNSQVGGRVQVSVGTAWSADGYASGGKSNGNYQGVGQQSGLFAGEGGYHVEAGHVNLVGGAIASTNAGKSELKAQTLTFSDLQNEMEHKTSSGSISGGYGGGMDGWKPVAEGATPSFGGGIPMNEKGGDNSTTYATLTEGNIVIGGKQTSAAELGVNTDAAAAHRALEALPNADKLLADQQIMAGAMGAVMAASKQVANDIGNQAMRNLENSYAAGLGDEERAWFEGLSSAEKTSVLKANQVTGFDSAEAQRNSWGIGSVNGRALEAVTTLLVGVVSGQGGGQVVTNALAPYAANLIGNKFDENHGSDPNAAAQLLSHALLGALLAEVNGGSAAGGAAAAAGGELAAKLLSEALYPGQTGDLNDAQKGTILALSQAVGALAAGIGSGVSGAALGSDIAGNAIENNYLSAPQRKAKDTERAECNGNMACLEAVDVRWAEVSQDQSRKVKDSYWSYLTPEEQFVLFSMKPGTKEYDSLLARGLAGSLDLGKPVPEVYQHVLRLLTETDWVGPQTNAPRGGLTLDSRNQIEIALLGPLFGLPGGVTTMAGGTPEQVAGANQFGAVAMDLAGSAQVLRPKNVVGDGPLSGPTDSYIQSTLTEYNVAFPSRYISGDMRIGNSIPSSVVFNSNIERHISTVDGFTQKSGVAGGHNLREFASFASSNGLQILDGPVQRSGGIYTIAYKIPAYDRTGGQIGYKTGTYYKTVYDPAYFSDAQIYNLGRTAAEGGYLKARSEGKFQYDASAGGVSFRVYLDKVTGAVTNFHPK